MPKVNDIAKSTAHSQHAELSGLLGGKPARAVDANPELLDANQALTERVAELEAALAAEQEAHAATKTALVDEAQDAHEE